MTSERFEKISQWVIFILFFLLLVGTPLVFTPMTRSVFEVNKLLLLRLVTLFTYLFWTFKSLLYRDNAVDHSESRWVKTGLEWPMAIWLIFNCLSTVFSQNIYVAIIGSYDRWEGIVTVFNYMMLMYMFAQLVTKRFQLTGLLWAILGSTALSAFYGVFQSLGYDIMSWSKDPTMRVFACINNPVHFCAYVAMTVPVGIAMILEKTSQTVTTFTDRITHTLKEKRIQFGFTVLMVILFRFMIFDGFLDLSFYLFLLLSLLTTAITTHTVFRVPSIRDIGIWAGYLGFHVMLFTLDWIPFSKEQWFAYFVLLGILFIVAPFPNRELTYKRSIFVFTLLIFYNQILSFSRATWIGFNIMMPLFYLLMGGFFAQKSEKHFTRHALFTGAISIIFTGSFIFDVAKYGILPILFVGTLLAVYLGYTWFTFQKEEDTPTSPLRDFGMLGAAILCLIFIFSHFLPLLFSPITTIIVTLGIMGIFTGLSYLSSPPVKRILEAIVIMLIFATIQFTAVSIIKILIYFSLIATFYLVGLKGKSVSREYKYWLLSFLVSFGGVMILSTLPTLISKLAFIIQNKSTLQVLIMGLGATAYMVYNLLLFKDFSPLKSLKGQIKMVVLALCITASLFPVKLFLEHFPTMGILKTELTAMSNLTGRVQSYEETSKTNPRISMWKSGIPWFKDYIWLGSGLDTVKFMYPKYRRSEYGKLEGGHNYTPDRLHNEYINTLVTRGLPATLLYYFGLILGWYIVMIKGFFRLKNSPSNAIIAALLTGAGIYLGQVFFNFGVVATLVLFYVFLGLGLAIVLRPAIAEECHHD